MSKTKTVDLGEISYFHYSSDLKIEPIIKAKHDGDYYQLKTTKDENVEIVNGEITVVTTEVTALKQSYKENDQRYGPNDVKTEVERIALLAKTNNASLDGQVIIRESDADSSRVFRILVKSNKVTVEEGTPAVAWPDGTTSPLWSI